MASEVVNLVVKFKDESTGELREFAVNMGEVGKAGQKMGRDLDEGGKKAKSGLLQAAEGFYFIKNAAKDVVGAISGVYSELQVVAEGAQIKTSFGLMASSIGENADTITAKMSEMAEGTASKTALAASGAAALGREWASTGNDLVTLMEVAKYKSEIFGGTAIKAFDAISDSMGSLNVRGLKQYGIIIDQERVYKQLAISLRKTVEQLTEAEKAQGLWAETLRIYNEQLAKTGPMADTAADSFERWDAASADLRQELGEGLLPAATNVVEIAGGLARETRTLISLLPEAQRQVQAGTIDWQMMGKAANDLYLLTTPLGYAQVTAAQNSKTALDAQAKAAAAVTTNVVDMGEKIRSLPTPVVDSTSIDTAKIATDNWRRSLGLIPKEVTVKAAFHVTTGPTRAETEEKAAQRLLDLPEQRAKKEELWGRIILESARQSTDARVKNAVAALDQEDRAYKAAIEKQKTDKTAFAVWTKGEEQKAAALRAAGRFKEAGEVEQGILLAQEWHRQNDTTTEGLEAEHLARLGTLRAGYNTALRNSSDDNLRLQRFAYQQEQTELANMEWRIKQTMITGQDYTKEWAGNWKNASQDAWLTAKKDIQGWDKEVESTLFKPRYFVIEGKYIPAVDTTGEEDRDRGGPPTTTPPTTGGGGKRGGGQQQGYENKQGGGVVSGALGQPRNITAHGGEIIIDPLAPMRGLAALARSGLLGNKSTTINLTANYPLQSGARLADDVRLLRMMYA